MGAVAGLTARPPRWAVTAPTGGTRPIAYRGGVTTDATSMGSFELPAGRAITPVTRDVSAPAGLVYQLMSAIGQGPQAAHDGANVLSRDGNDLVCEFWTEIEVPVVGRRTLRTREAVRLLPPNALAFRHLDGPVRGLTERISVEAIDERRSRVVYEAVLPGTRLVDRLKFSLARRTIERAVATHFADIAARAEARAVRSRTHRADPVTTEATAE